jgi:hypothetical protein
MTGEEEFCFLPFFLGFGEASTLGALLTIPPHFLVPCAWILQDMIFSIQIVGAYEINVTGSTMYYRVLGYSQVVPAGLDV